MLARVRGGRGRVYTRSPVRRSYPLNGSRLAWWLHLPWLAGGATLHDQIGGYHAVNGAANPATNPVVWAGSTRPGSFGQFAGDGSASYFRADGIAALLAGRNQATLAYWAYRSGAQKILIGGGIGPNPSGSGRFGTYWDSSNTIYALAENASLAYPNAVATNTGWVFVVLVYNGTLTGLARVALYIGSRSTPPVAITLSAGGGNPGATLPTLSPEFSFGQLDTGSATYSAAPMDDISLFSAPLGITSIIQLWNESRTGYPESLVWVNSADQLYTPDPVYPPRRAVIVNVPFSPLLLQ